MSLLQITRMMFHVNSPNLDRKINIALSCDVNAYWNFGALEFEFLILRKVTTAHVGTIRSLSMVRKT